MVILACEEQQGALIIVAGPQKEVSGEEVVTDYLVQGYEIASIVRLGGTRTRSTLVQREEE